MTIDEAIEILELNVSDSLQTASSDYLNAARLGIEALKHQKSCPYFEYQAKDELLPGETKD